MDRQLIIHSYLQSKQINPKLTGYDLLVDAIDMSLQDPSLLNRGLCKLIYPAIGKSKKLDWRGVERSIRSAITSAGHNSTNLTFIKRACNDLNVCNKQSARFYNYVGIVVGGLVQYVTDVDLQTGDLNLQPGKRAFQFGRHQAVVQFEYLAEQGFTPVIIQAEADAELVNNFANIHIGGQKDER